MDGVNEEFVMSLIVIVLPVVVKSVDNNAGWVSDSTPVIVTLFWFWCIPWFGCVTVTTEEPSIIDKAFVCSFWAGTFVLLRTTE